MRGTVERDQVYCFIVSGCFQWIRDAWRTEKRCITVNAEHRRRLKSIAHRINYYLFIYSFFSNIRVSVFHTLAPDQFVIFAWVASRPILTKRDLDVTYTRARVRVVEHGPRVAFDEEPLLKSKHACVSIAIVRYDICNH